MELIYDCWLEVAKYLDDKSKFNLFTCSPNMFEYFGPCYLYHLNRYINISCIPKEYKGYIKRVKGIHHVNELKGYPSLTHVKFNNKFNMEFDSLPETIISIKFGKFFKKDIGLNLPENLEILSFSKDSQFNKPINDLPHSLKILILGYKFNQPLNRLPPLIYLKLGNTFNQLLNKLPPSLLYLETGRQYNRPFEYLPSSLLYLKTGDQYNCIFKYLPSSLLYLETGYCYNHPFERLPSRLLYLETGYQYNCPFEYLPPSLKILILGHKFNQPLNRLPLLIYLRLNCSFNQLLTNLPQSLKHIEFKYNYRQSIQNWPKSLISMISSTEFIINNVDNLPENLETILYYKSPCNIRYNGVNEILPSIKIMEHTKDRHNELKSRYLAKYTKLCVQNNTDNISYLLSNL